MAAHHASSLVVRTGCVKTLKEYFIWNTVFAFYNIIYMNMFDVDVLCFIGFIYIFVYIKEGYPYRKVILLFIKAKSFGMFQN